ncbi:hypothetical protein BB561_001742 [Smittium simulii]|uniref:SET domain-containing protein n=1 Tax=Smittium simulii TaxID=133385 RepID=A0A2T9YT76_9FUNG|nr:hypothetical protein BB561_001742 [Smittium simulii]
MTFTKDTLDLCDHKNLEILNEYPVKLKSKKKNKNLYFVASRDIVAGATVFLEASHAFIIKNTFKEQFSKKINSSAQTNSTEIDEQKCKNEKDDLSMVTFITCNYCNENCKSTENTRTIRCLVLEKLKQNELFNKVDIDRFNFVLNLIEQQISEDSQPQINSKNYIKSSLIHGILPPKGFQGRYWKARVNIESNVLIETIRKLQLHQKHNIKLSRITNYFNLYEYYALDFYDLNANNVYIAKGLFPLFSAGFNHSCAPNCSFGGNANGILAVRSLVDIKSGSTLTISKIDLYQPKYARRRELYLQYQFWCNCARCRLPVSESTDLELEGILCPKCKNQINTTSKNCISNTQNNVSNSSIGKNILIKNSDDLNTSTSNCFKCNYEINADQIEDLKKKLNRDYTRAINTYHHINNQLLSNEFFSSICKSAEASKEKHKIVMCYKKPIKMLESLLLEYENTKKISPYNHQLFNVHRVLLNYYMVVCDYSNALTHCKHITVIIEIKSYYKKAKSVLEMAKSEAQISLGPDHLLYKKITKLIEFVLRGPTENNLSDIEANINDNIIYQSKNSKILDHLLKHNKGNALKKHNSTKKPKGLLKQPSKNVYIAARV